MDRLHPPQPLELHGNIAANWKRFKQSFQIYKIASGLDTKSKEVQSMTLLHVIGQEAVEVYNTFQWTGQECDDCDTDIHSVKCLLLKFENYCLPRKNVTVERHVFFSRKQGEGESFDNFITDLKLKAKSCEFENLTESLIKDRIVAGVNNEYLRARLLRELDLNLNKAEIICKAAETSEWQLKALNEEKNFQVVNS